jgi:cytochrome c biogenesis protein CcmG, thiol:disulfide interchange protein DsbE
VAGGRLKRKLKTGAALAFVAALLAIFIHPSYRNGTPSLRGQTAKDFSLTIDGKPTQLSDLRGKVVLLNFWATWCQPCVEEAPSLNALQKKIAPLGGTVLGVSVDDDQAAYAHFLKSYNVDFPTYRDPSKQIPLSYGTSMYPETYVIDRDGKIDSKIVGPQDWTSPAMMAYLDSVLRVK